MSTMSKTVRKAKSGSGFTRTLSCPSCTLAEPQSIVWAMVATLVVVAAPGLGHRATRYLVLPRSG